MTIDPQPPFDTGAFLCAAGTESTTYQANDIIFAQGDASASVLYLERGTVKLSVSSRSGKEAVLGMLKAGDFFGERVLTGRLVRSETATAVRTTTVVHVPAQQMTRLFHEQHTFSARFITYMLARNVRIEADLVDQLMNSTEKRLARLLLLMAGDGEPDHSNGVLPTTSQETLAAMIGTTRPRVSFFMTKFKKLGFIEYDRGLKVKNSLHSVIVHD